MGSSKSITKIIVTLLLITFSLFGRNNSTIPDTGGADTGTTSSANNITTKLTASEVKKVSFSSKVLNRDMNINIYLPKGYSSNDKYPVLYMLHGYSANEDTWMPGLNIDKKADELIEGNKIKPLIIVAPQIDNSFGINSSLGLYEDYLYKEVVSFIDTNYSTISSRDGRYIGGLSMGGYAALYLAFSHLDMFSKVGGHSPAIYVKDAPNGDIQWLYPTESVRHERDPIYIARDKDLTSLKVYLDCGDQDYFKFYEGCNELYKALQDKGVKSEYHLYPGAHDGAYWAEHVEEYLLFYAGN